MVTIVPVSKRRREILTKGAAVLTGVTAGEVVLSGCDSVRAASGTTSESAVGSFGWEVRNFTGNGADAFFRITNKMVLNTATIDAAFSIISLPAMRRYATAP